MIEQKNSNKIIDLLSKFGKIYFIIPVTAYIIGFIYCQAITFPFLKSDTSPWDISFDGLLPFSNITYLILGTKYLGFLSLQIIIILVVINALKYSFKTDLFLESLYNKIEVLKFFFGTFFLIHYFLNIGIIQQIRRLKRINQ